MKTTDKADEVRWYRYTVTYQNIDPQTGKPDKWDFQCNWQEPERIPDEELEKEAARQIDRERLSTFSRVRSVRVEEITTKTVSFQEYDIHDS